MRTIKDEAHANRLNFKQTYVRAFLHNMRGLTKSTKAKPLSRQTSFDALLSVNDYICISPGKCFDTHPVVQCCYFFIYFICCHKGCHMCFRHVRIV